MTHIFVSYSRKDSETVDHIVGRLKRDGLDIWLDRGAIKGGDLWRKEIVEAIDNASACLLMVSPNSVASKNVRKEIDLADGADKDLVPMLLAPVEIPAELRHQLAGIQWIEYYRDPEVKYAELVEVLHARKPKPTVTEPETTREVETVIKGLDLSKFTPEKEEQLLNLIAVFTGTQRADLKVTKRRSGSVHIFVNMPADAAYRLKTAALNRDLRLINYGIEALRLTGDRHFIFLKTGRIAPRKPDKPGGGGSISGLTRMIVLFLSFLTITVGLLIASKFISSRFATETPTVTSTFTPTITKTPTITPISTIVFSAIPPPPEYTLTVNANCRKGPGSSYNRDTAIPLGENVEMLGRNSTTTWIYIRWYEQKFNQQWECWVPLIDEYNRPTGQTTIDLQKLKVLQLDQDFEPPNITANANPTSIYPPLCGGPFQTTVTAVITDNYGVMPSSVILWYQENGEYGTTGLRSKPMHYKEEGDPYIAVLNIQQDSLPVPPPPYGPNILKWWVEAQDPAGNLSKSNEQRVSINDSCP